MPVKVVQWATGNTGIHALRALIDNPAFELVGLRVFSDAKAGRDAGEIAGRAPTGVIATCDAEETLAIAADCVLFMCSDPVLENPAKEGSSAAALVDDMCRILESGRNVVTTAVACLTYPAWVRGDVVGRLEAACKAGSSAFICIGIDPGFMNDWLPLALSGFATNVRGILAQEILNYGSWNVPVALHGAGYGLPPSDDLNASGLEPLRNCWGAAVLAVADKLEIRLDDIDVVKDYALTDFAFDIAAFHVPVGAVAAQRFAVRGLLGGEAVIVAEHITRLHDDVAPDWPRLASGSGGFRVVMDASPPLTAEVALGATASGNISDPCIDACHATAARAVNAIPLICRAKSGVHSQFDLPLIYGQSVFVRDRSGS